MRQESAAWKEAAVSSIDIVLEGLLEAGEKVFQALQPMFSDTLESSYFQYIKR